ncbi:ribonuclease H-like domain-containing protein [Patescibacteria group bacterium]|nr:ribonuclease H-like domain-containing protein [Patescibacteria group bacterium]MBU1922276.1 ribonuclease H-like domain-containing protein [Patescibacteria group bacterium]
MDNAAQKLFLDIETLPAREEDFKKLKKIYRNKKKRGFVLGTFEQYAATTGLDGTWGRIFCIGYAIDDGPVQCLVGDEVEIIKQFWDMARDMDLFIGFNLIDFDLRFIVQRSIIHGVKPSREIPFRRYSNNPVYDVMWEWTKWGSKISMDELSQALGFKSSKGAIDGSRVNEYYQKGKYKEIEKYCAADVELTRKIYKRLRFEG